ncbi:MAG: ATP-binding protein [Paludibacteraceae bacterium]|nr:ATP-binding protein [Paludibacteraceae bacterium]
MELTLALKNNIDEINRLHTFIEEVGEVFALPMKTVMNLNLVLEEAVTNVIMYAYPKEEHEYIHLTAKEQEGKLIFILTDSGKAFDPTQAPDADITLSADDRQIGGLGIFLIRKIMNEVKYERIDGKNVLTLEKEL